MQHEISNYIHKCLSRVQLAIPKMKINLNMFLQGSRMKCQLPVMSNDWQLEKVTQPRCDNFHTMMAEPQRLLPADLS